MDGALLCDLLTFMTNREESCERFVRRVDMEEKSNLGQSYVFNMQYNKFIL